MSVKKRRLAFISPKYQNIVFGFFMSLFMSCLMSLVITLINLGFVDNLVMIWIHAWFSAFVVAFPTVLTVIPVVRRVTMAFIRIG